MVKVCYPTLAHTADGLVGRTVSARSAHIASVVPGAAIGLRGVT